MSAEACVTTKCNTILDKLIQTFLPFKLVDFLNTELLRTNFIYLNFWSIIHILAGSLFFLIWSLFSKKFLTGLKIWGIINIIFEIIELLLGLKGLYPALFFEETIDIIWDIVTDLVGYIIMWLLYNKLYFSK